MAYNILAGSTVYLLKLLIKHATQGLQLLIKTLRQGKVYVAYNISYSLCLII